MAFLLPHLALAPAQCGPTYCAPRRPTPRPSFASFLSVVDDALNELHNETQREVKRQVRHRAFNPRFDLREREEGYEVEAEVPGFEQENIDIEVTDEQTLRISGNTEKKSERALQETIAKQATSTTGPQKSDVEQTEASKVPDTETESVKSHQATVEDDFEDLGAETSSTVSTTVSATSTPTSSSKGKQEAIKRVEPATTEASAQQQHLSQKAQLQHREWLSERAHGSFARTFRFPSRIDGANVRAQLKSGVLYIAVPKAPAPEVRHIIIQ